MHAYRVMHELKTWMPLLFMISVATIGVLLSESHNYVVPDKHSHNHIILVAKINDYNFIKIDWSHHYVHN